MAREYPCCLCPAKHENFKQIPQECKKCDFKVEYVDKRGWIYFVRAGIGLNTYKIFYKKPNKTGAHSYKATDWKDTFTEAQIQLNQLAKEKGWKEIKQDGGDEE